MAIYQRPLRQYFEVHTPSTGQQATAYIQFGISSALEYKILKQEGILYSYLHSNSIYMTLHQFVDIETIPAGTILFKHPKMTYWTTYHNDILSQMQRFLHEATIIAPSSNTATFPRLDFNDKNVPFITISIRNMRHTFTQPHDDKPTKQTIHLTVFELQCGRSDLRRVTALMQHITGDPATNFHTGVFIPNSTRITQPQTFFNLLATQNDYLTTICAVLVAGIFPSFWHSTPVDNNTTTTYAIQILNIPGMIPITPNLN